MADSPESAHSASPGLQGLGIGALNVGNLLDTVEFVKNAWSAFGVPSSLAPTVDIDELDRRIADLKAVEQWLTLNLNLLRTSVQALEVQRGTLATLKAYGTMLGAPSGLPGLTALAQAMAAAASGAVSAATAGTPVPGAASTPATATPQQGAHDARTPVAEMAAAAGGAAPADGSARADSGARADGSARAAAGDAVPADEGARAATDGGAPASASGEAPVPAGGETPSPAAPPLPGLDAGAWWELLNRQFNQIAAAALGAGGQGAALPGAAPSATGKKRAGRGGAPVAGKKKKTPSRPKTKSSPVAEKQPGRRGRRPDR